MRILELLKWGIVPHLCDSNSQATAFSERMVGNARLTTKRVAVCRHDADSMS
jgi:hypothetical protein